MTSPNTKPSAQTPSPVMSSVRPGMPRNSTLLRSGMTRLASPAGRCGACCAYSTAGTNRAANIVRHVQNDGRARRTVSIRIDIGEILLGSGELRWRPLELAPEEIHGNTDQHEHEATNCLSARALGDEQNHRDAGRKQDVQRRKHGISDCAVRTLRIRPRTTKDEQPDRREHVEHERGKDN